MTKKGYIYFTYLCLLRLMTGRQTCVIYIDRKDWKLNNLHRNMPNLCRNAHVNIVLFHILKVVWHVVMLDLIDIGSHL